tara:strand:- start:8247 stop:9386 length:1140 start_codon:yes stop_codon:yes gene_type:complete
MSESTTNNSTANSTANFESSEKDEQSSIKSASSVSSQSDFYQILGVNEDASYVEIKKKWLKLSLIYHPDKCGGDNEKFRQINLAYKVLSNPENRKKYNDSLAKTFDQLRQEHRDLGYDLNPDYVVQDGEEKKFNRDKFMEEFEKSRNKAKSTTKKESFFGITDSEILSDQDANALPKANNKSLDDILAKRDAELYSFRDVQKSDLGNPQKGDLDEFNFIFNQVQKINRQRTDMEEILENPLANDFNNGASSDFAELSSMDPSMYNLNNEMISKLTSTFRDKVKPFVEVQDFNEEELSRIRAEETKEMFERLQAERNGLNQELHNKQVAYEITIDDDSKLLQPSESDLTKDMEQNVDMMKQWVSGISSDDFDNGSENFEI